MLMILFTVKLKPDKESEFLRLVTELTRSTQAEDEGCIAYTFYRQTDNPLRVALFEQWRDQASLDSHIRRLSSVLGPADDDPSLPPGHVRRRLPKSFMDLFEETAVTRYEPLLDIEPAM